jgi:hypothetical protein
MASSESLVLRVAGRDDAAAVAALHADSWRQHYRVAYSDARTGVSLRLLGRAARSGHAAADPNGSALVVWVRVRFVGRSA